MGEKVSANPVTGTGSLTIPIYSSPGRAGFGPELSLSYDSGSGNGPFGLGWSLALPAITRKTDKGLPQYADDQASDIFLFAGAEDLMPLLVQSGGKWIPEVEPNRLVYGKTYAIQRYRPRVEGLFARIERWINIADSQDTFWRSISKNNVTSWYGKTAESRVADPGDPGRIFSWLICESYDDKGNAISYNYKGEDSDGADLTLANERNRSRSAGRYPKYISYGNRTPYFLDLTQPAAIPLPTDWCFQVVFDYGEHDLKNPVPDDTGKHWNCRLDPFSTYRSTFEVRTYRLCRRVLMFHHFPKETNVRINCLVRSTDLVYSQPSADPTQPYFSFLLSAAQSGYTRDGAGGYITNSLPPVEFEYTDAIVNETAQQIDPRSLENLPYGLDGSHYRWVDLDGEGVSGILTEQAGAWFYKANLSPMNQQTVQGITTTLPQFAPVEVMSRRPSMAALSGGRQQLMDLTGDGRLDLVDFSPPTPGFFERSPDADWEPFQTFSSLPVVDWQASDLKFVDLTGDGFPDLLICEDSTFRWHASLAAQGFGPAARVAQALDEEAGPKLVFADSTESVFLADLSGDGLTDLVRIRNGEVCYWPNLGYGHFGPKVTMDQSPRFDRQDLFDGRRIQLADIDGSGTTDIVYFASGRVDLYFNQSGNGWGARRTLDHFPSVESISAGTVVDLLGNGTACLVWSSPLPGNTRRPMRYIDLMGGVKPHLLVRMTNNLGGETVLQYAPSTKFYVQDKLAGTPWVTRLPFPVQVVEQVQTYDYISRDLFVTSYSYHHGYFDGVEREFRGFGRVDQIDTQQFATLTASSDFPQPANLNAASSVPPVRTTTWYHTGAFFGKDRISRHLAHEYYSEGDASEGVAGLSDQQLSAMLLDDTVLPTQILLPNNTHINYDLSAEEMREACRALRGSILRQEIYALDDVDESDRPYSVSERNYTIEVLQPQGTNPFGVFLVHARETVDFHYERKLYNVLGGMLVDPKAPPPGAQTAADPRITHTATMGVDPFGNVLQTVSVGYGRRFADSDLSLPDQLKQTTLLVSYTDNTYTVPVVSPVDSYRAPLPAQTSTYELLQVKPSGVPLAGVTNLFSFVDFQTALGSFTDATHDINYENLHPSGLNAGEAYRRLIARARTLYRPDDMGAAAGNPRALLALGQLDPLALPGTKYTLAFTPGLVTNVYQRGGVNLLPTPPAVLGSTAGDGGGYVDLDGDGHWWIPSGRLYYIDTAPASPQERNRALQHFLLPRRFEDPFGKATTIDYDTDNDMLLMQGTDAVGNVMSAANDFRVLKPNLVTDANGNQTAIDFDALGLMAATAVMGKLNENVGDQLTGLTPDLTQAQIDPFFNALDPHTLAAPLLGNASTRVVYDVNKFYHSRQSAPGDPSKWLPVYAATLARETHFFDLGGGPPSLIRITFSYSDGYGREIQKKIQAEPGPVVDKGPAVDPRWVGSGWTIFNNKGKPVRKYEPFFSQLPVSGHQFEFGAVSGVSPILCYDPVERVVATIHPNHTYEKVVFDPWHQATWDVNDTVAQDDPTADPDVGSFFKRLPLGDYSPTWRVQYSGGTLLEQDAATKAAAHANTPAVDYFDTLGRAFLKVSDNGAAGKYLTHNELDIQNYNRSVTDPLGRQAMVYDYSMPGKQIHQASMEAGERWMLNDADDKSIRSWDNRGHNFRTEYDDLRRTLHSFVLGTDVINSDSRTTGSEVLFEKIDYGEGQAGDQTLNVRTRVYQRFDSAGMTMNFATDPATNQPVAFDFKGNLLRGSRKFIQDATILPDWSKPQNFLGDVFVSIAAYDALNRVVSATSPDGSVTHPAYNEANLLESLSVNLAGAGVARTFVNNIDYNARGQRVLISYGDSAATAASIAYQYDPLTFRLTNLTTTRPGFPASQQTVQDLSYTYDPIGNPTHVQDDADIQNVVFFNNQRVEPSAAYTYDAIYRLTLATGREQLGLNGGGTPLPPSPSTYNDVSRVLLTGIGDGKAMGTYTEQYQYDDVCNFQQLIHTGSNPANPGWTRSYTYAEASLLEPLKFSNRLTRTTVTGSVPLNENYTHDLHGNMTAMPQLQIMQWDFRDQLQMTQRQAVNATDADGNLHKGERTFYVYDSVGERVRKTTQSANGAVTKERFYLGGMEVYRKYDGAGKTTLERQTLHVKDDQRRVALVETKTGGAAAIRFQFDNHLGTACLELDEAGAVITYEEYYPYGSTSYQAGRTLAEVSLKRYRYVGKERDEETGLCQLGRRYYASWLGRWTAVDPAGMVDGTNLYFYARGNPVYYVDKTGTDSAQATEQNLGLSNPGPVPQQKTGTITTDATVLTSGTSSTAPQSGPTSSFTLLTHLRFRVDPNVEFGLQGGFGGNFPLPFSAPFTPGNTTGTGNFALTLHVGEQQSSDDSVRTQTLHGGYFVLGNLWGQSPQLPSLFPDQSAQQATNFNPYGSAMYALSHLRNLEDPKATDEQNKKLTFHQFEFDFNLSAAAQRYGSINGVTVDGLVNANAVFNFALATDKGVNTVNLEVLGGLNVAGRVDPLDPASAINRVTPLSGKVALGLGFVHTFGDYAVGVEVVGGKELAPTVGPSLDPHNPNAKANTGWGAGAYTFGLNFGLSAINTPKPLF